jgi:NAD(P)-dependent dehydrogenase (short-subunit alcohol dehydrogenase family)
MVKFAIVTGTSRGIGFETTKALLDRGFQVVGIARGKQEELSKKEGYWGIEGDVADERVLSEAVALAKTKFGGRLDAVIVNAGVLEPITRIEGLNVDDLKRSFDINFFSPVSLITRCVPMLRSSNGIVIHISSGASNNPYVGWLSYCSSKAALNMLSSVLAAEESSITSVALRPGVVVSKSLNGDRIIIILLTLMYRKPT